MARTVLIASSGIYQERVWKSIIRSGASKVYLISDSKSEYEKTRRVADELEKRINAKLADVTIERKEVDFSKLEDVYKVFIGIIERERAENLNVRIILDVTSTTKEALYVASNLANAYKLTLSYVPRKKKSSKEIIEERYSMEKDDPGNEVVEFLPVLPVLGKYDAKILNKLANKRYESVNELIKELIREESIHPTNAVAFEKKMLRTVRDLENKRIVRSEERGRVKLVDLTEAGKGIAGGLEEANKTLKKAGLKSLIELLYTP